MKAIVENGIERVTVTSRGSVIAAQARRLQEATREGFAAGQAGQTDADCPYRCDLPADALEIQLRGSWMSGRLDAANKARGFSPVICR